VWQFKGGVVVRSLVLALVLGVTGGLASVQAATVTVNPVGGSWSNPAHNQGTAGVTGIGTGTLAWGSPAPWSTKSSYNFSAGSAVTSTTPGAFLVGSYTHKNGTIRASSAWVGGATLNLNVSGAINGQSYSFANSFRFSHDETLNAARPCAGGDPKNCGDLVSIASLVTTPFTVTQGNSIFTLLIDGFVAALGGPIVTSFLTPEDKSKTLFLQARWQEQTINIEPPPPPPPPPPPAPVPLPAAGFLLIGAIGAMVAARRRAA
jgi:hypothetical protein